jgi:hypothetical protein
MDDSIRPDSSEGKDITINPIDNQIIVYDFISDGKSYIGISNISMNLFKTTGRFTLISQEEAHNLLNNSLRGIEDHFTMKVKECLDSKEYIYVM